MMMMSGTQLANDLNDLTFWTDSWQLPLNVSKCRVLRLGRTNHNYAYTLNGNDLQDISALKDLRITTDRELKFHDQTATIVTVITHETQYNHSYLVSYRIAGGIFMYQWPFVKILYSKYLPAKNFITPCLSMIRVLSQSMRESLSPNDNSNKVLNYFNPNTSK